MAAFAVLSFVGAIFLQATVRGSSFLPASDAGFLAVEVRSPASSSLDYSKLKLDAAAALASTMNETKATMAYPNASGGRIYVDIGKSTERQRSAALIAKELREKVARLVGAEY